MMNPETQKAFDWARNAPYQSVAARYAKALALEVERLEGELAKADDHPLVIQQGGTSGVDRCHRVINKQQGKIERLQTTVAKMSHRRCHDCGNVAYHLLAVIPYVCCEECGSQDTRLIREAAVAAETTDGSTGHA